MTRIFVLICAFFLMLDLAADGRFGQAKFVSPKNHANSSLASSHSPSSVKVEFQDGQQTPHLGSSLLQFESCQETPPLSQALQIIEPCRFGSSGGLSL